MGLSADGQRGSAGGAVMAAPDRAQRVIDRCREFTAVFLYERITPVAARVESGLVLDYEFGHRIGGRRWVGVWSIEATRDARFTILRESFSWA